MATAADTTSEDSHGRGNRECPITEPLLSLGDVEARFLTPLSNAGKQSRHFGSIKFLLKLAHHFSLSVFFSLFFVSPTFVAGIKPSGKTVI